MTKREIENNLRAKWTKAIFEVLEAEGEDVGMIKDNAFNFPVLDELGNEREIEVVVKVPKGSIKDNEPYDLYGLREEYQINCKLKEEKLQEKRKKLEKQLERKKELERKKKEMKEKRE